MTKKELLAKVAVKAKKELSVADGIYTALCNIIHSELKAGNEVQLFGIGKFKPHTSKERQGRNPATGRTITIAPKTRAKFYSSKSLDDTLNAA